ncbi:MAG: hypothetical protein E6713_07295 [Sporomusaceae bacterium]|nr:hypothetical protein [Sporomusaceae bacterium]
MSQFAAMPLDHLILIILLAGYIIYQQTKAQLVRGRKYVVMPLILLFFTYQSLTKLGDQLYQLTLPIFVLLGCGLFTGAVAAGMAKIVRKEDGCLYQEGGWRSLLPLCLIVPIRVAVFWGLHDYPSMELLNHGGTVYLLFFSAHLVSRSGIMIVKNPEIWNLYMNERNRK